MHFAYIFTRYLGIFEEEFIIKICIFIIFANVLAEVPFTATPSLDTGSSSFCWRVRALIVFKTLFYNFFIIIYRCLFYLKESIEQSIAVSNLTAATSTNNSTSEHLQSYIYLPAELTGRLLLNEGDVGNHGDVSHPTITDDDGSQFILKKKKFTFFSSSSSQNRANPLDETLFEQDDSVFSTAKGLFIREQLFWII